MANEAENKYITVAYKLYVPMSGNDHELVEEATPEHPFQIISGMGLALDAFEAQIVPLAKGDTFDFTLSIDEAYGPYVEEAVQRVPRSVFEIEGRLDRRYIYEGAIVPLMNGDGGNLLPWLKRGARVCVIGRLRLRAYSSPTTKQWEAGADVFVETIELVGVRQEITPEAIEREISGGRLDPSLVLNVLRKFADQ